MTERIAVDSPSPNARITGVVYLLYFVTAIFAVVLVGGIVITGDAAKTASNILAHETLFRAGFAIGLVGTALYVAVTALFYRLFKPVDKTVALLAAFLSLVGCAVQAAGSLFQIAPTIILAGDRYLGAFSAEQLQSLSLLSLNLSVQSGYINIVFFGFFDLLIGYLVFKSTFLPRVLGLFMAVAGLGWLTFLSPSLGLGLSPFVDIVGFVAEMLLMLWLLVKGVDVPRWREQAALNTPSL
jgi:hypothetical protein